MIENKIVISKQIGRRDMDMKTDLKKVFDEMDSNYTKPYFNDVKESF